MNHQMNSEEIKAKKDKYVRFVIGFVGNNFIFC
jgi:hypothetical protein